MPTPAQLLCAAALVPLALGAAIMALRQRARAISQAEQDVMNEQRRERRED